MTRFPKRDLEPLVDCRVFDALSKPSLYSSSTKAVQGCMLKTRVVRDQSCLLCYQGSQFMVERVNESTIRG